MSKSFEICPQYFDSEETAIAQSLVDFGFSCIGYDENPLIGDTVYGDIKGWKIISCEFYLCVIYRKITWFAIAFDHEYHGDDNGELSEVWEIARSAYDIIKTNMALYSGKYVQLTLF